jgi:hypothetical protein
MLLMTKKVGRMSFRIAYNVSVLYDVADFQQKAQYEAPKLN